MGIEDAPSIAELRNQINVMQLPLGIGSFFGSKTCKKIRAQLKETEKQLAELTSCANMFNEYFSKDGWVISDYSDLSMMRGAIEIYEQQGAEDANEFLIECFSPKAVAEKLIQLWSVEALRPRQQLIQLASEDYSQLRYHAVAPVLLPMIDGAVNDTIGVGFHAEKAEMDCWDSITTADGSIDIIKTIFNTGRYKTCTEQIDKPYRNGILHGRDLGYNNREVAAKCWAFLFVVADWSRDKQTETERQEKFLKEKKSIDFKEVLASSRKHAEHEKLLEAWEPRTITQDYLDNLNEAHEAAPETPEHTVLAFMELWRKENYGYMAKMFGSCFASITPGEVREELSCTKVASYDIVEICDEVPAFIEIKVKIITKDNRIEIRDFRMIYEDAQGDSCVSGAPSGAWKVIYPRELKPPPGLPEARFLSLTQPAPRLLAHYNTTLRILLEECLQCLRAASCY